MSKSKAFNPKKVVLISLLFVFIVSVYSAVIYHVWQQYKNYGKIRAHRDTEDQIWSDWYYNDVKYSVAPGLSLYDLYDEIYTEENGFYLISWNWYVPLLGISKVFGDSIDNPHYLVGPYRGDRYCVRVRENFDYMDEEYVVCDQEYFGRERIWIDTDFSFKLKDVYYIDKSIERECGTEPIAYFNSHSKSFESLEFYGSIFLIDGEYYVNFTYYSTHDTEQTYKAKPEFIELLKNADILNSD